MAKKLYLLVHVARITFMYNAHVLDVYPNIKDFKKVIGYIISKSYEHTHSRI